MKNKKIFMILLSSLLITSCITNTSNSNIESTTTSSINSSSVITQSNISVSSTIVSSISNSENEVKIKKIVANALDEDNNIQSISKKEKNKHEDEINYIIIYKSQTDIQFTITLDNPEAYGIDALRVKCDDENAQIQVDGEWKPIAFESDGTRVVNWSSEDPYEKTYNIRTTSDDAMNIFEVIDIRLAGHSKFQSKETKNTDIGNNELQIHKMDEDAYKIDVIENTFEYIKFKLAVKESYKDIIHNITVDGETADSEGIYTLYENKNITVKYDYKINDELMVNRSNDEKIELVFQNVFGVIYNCKYINSDLSSYYDSVLSYDHTALLIDNNENTVTSLNTIELILYKDNGIGGTGYKDLDKLKINISNKTIDFDVNRYYEDDNLIGYLINMDNEYTSYKYINENIEISLSFPDSNEYILQTKWFEYTEFLETNDYTIEGVLVIDGVKK